MKKVKEFAQFVLWVLMFSIVVALVNSACAQDNAPDINLKSDAPDSTSKFSLNTEVTIASRNVWRGVNYGNNLPTIQGTLGVIYKSIEVGAFGTVTVNGDRKGFGNWMELYSTYTLSNRWSVTLDDYYFFSYDSLNDYFNWNPKNTQHLIEARVKYNVDKKFWILGSYNFYAGDGSQKAFYFEGEYFLTKELSLLLGALTGPSTLNFYAKGGVTTVGLSATRQLKMTKNLSVPLKTRLIFNPNYKNIATYTGAGCDPGYNGLGRNPVNFVISVTF